MALLGNQVFLPVRGSKCANGKQQDYDCMVEAWHIRLSILLGEDVLDDRTLNVRQTIVTTGVAIGKFLVIKT